MNCKRKMGGKKSRKILLVTLKKPLLTFLMKNFKLYILLMYLLGMCHFRDEVIFILRMSHPFGGCQLGEYKQAFPSGKTEDTVIF